MNTRTNLILATLTLAALLGCVPKKRIVWSPDCRRAAVLSDHGLFFIDGDGKVLPPRLPGSVGRCAWFADNRRVAVSHSVKAKTWDALEAALDKPQLEQIIRIAESIKPRMLAYEGDWDDFELDNEKRMPTGEEIAAVLYLRDRLPDGLPEKLGEKWTDVEDIEVDLSRLQRFTVGKTELEPGLTLACTVSGIEQPLVSPDGRLISFLTGRGDDNAALYVVTADGEAPRLVAENVASDYAWRPDSRGLAYIHSSHSNIKDGDSLQLGSLTTITISDKDGKLLPKWTERKDEVGLVFNRTMAVKWLSDGKLLFSSLELHLPTTTRDMPQQWSLFALDPKMPASVHRVLARDFDEPLDLAIPLFEVSPDETRVLLPGPNGRVTIYEFASGESTVLVDEKDLDSKTRSLPTWRNNTEICLVSRNIPEGASEGKGDAKSGDQGLPVASHPASGKTGEAIEIVLWKAGKIRVLSRDWPEDMKEGWLLSD